MLEPSRYAKWTKDEFAGQRKVKSPPNTVAECAGCRAMRIFDLVVHPALLSHGLRFALVQAASGAGLRLEIGNIHARLAEPIILEAVKIRARNAEESRARRGCRSCRNLSELALARPFRDGRLFRALVVEDLRAVVDLRPKRVQGREVAGLSPVEPGGQANWTLRWLRIHEDPARQSEFVALNQSYYFEDICADFSEDRLGTFRAAGAELGAGFFIKASAH